MPFLFLHLIAALFLMGQTSSPAGSRIPPPLYTCSEAEIPTVSTPRLFGGRYDREFERSSFEIDQKECTVWLRGELGKVYERVGGWSKGAEFSVLLEVEGVMSPPGHFGHRGMWERELRVSRVISVQSIPK